jgi:hypothetical protein
MFVSVDRNYGWSIGFASPSWTLQAGKQFPLRFRIDKSPWFDASATAVGSDHVIIPMKAESTLITLFRGGQTLRIYDGQEYFFFNLTGTSRLIADLAQCASRYVSLDSQQSGGGIPQQPQPSRIEGQLDVELRLEATRLLSNFLSKAGFTETSIMSPAEVPDSLKAVHAVAIAGAQLAFALVVPRETNATHADLIGILTGEYAKDCPTQFASGSTREMIDGAEITSGFAACKSSSNSYQLRFVIAPSTRGPFLIGLASDLGQTLDEAAPELPEAEFRKAVYLAGR